MLKSLISSLPWSVILFAVIAIPIAAKDECYTNADCFNNFRHLRIACCKNSRDSDRICQPYNCEGRYCFTHGDCGGEGECCLDNKCIHSQSCPRCNSSSHCANLEYCCKRAQGNVCRRNCVGERCSFNSECGGPGEYCDSANSCAKLQQTSGIMSTDISKEIPKQNPTQRTATVIQKFYSSQSTDSLPIYAIVFIILFAIVFLTQWYLLYLHCCKKQSPQTYILQYQAEPYAEREIRDIHAPVPREAASRSLPRPPASLPSFDVRSANEQATPRQPLPPSSYGSQGQTHEQNIPLTPHRQAPLPPSYDGQVTREQDTSDSTPQPRRSLRSSRRQHYEYTDGRFMTFTTRK